MRSLSQEAVLQIYKEMTPLPCPPTPTGTPVLQTSKQHLLQQVVNLGHAKEFDELNLFDHLPGDALQGG